MTLKSFATLLAISTCAPGALGSVVFSENFEVDPSANWVVNSGPGVNSADFSFDYSTLGIPAAPGGSGTRGLKLQANLNPNIAAGLTGAANASSPNGTFAPGGVFGGITVSPNQSGLTNSDFVMTFDWWGNYNGPVNGGGTGTTQVSQFGVLTSGTATQWIGSATKDSVSFAATLDGGSASDYRAYSSAAPTSYAAANAVYAAPGGAINNTNAYYATPFPGGATAPAGQLSSFPLQTGATAAGVSGFQWNQVEIAVNAGIATWRVNGTLFATIDLSTVTTGGNNIFFGHSDTNGGASIDETHPDLLFTLIDNVQIVPEPTTVALALAAFGLLARRRR
jgi:hypothetical protein